MATANRVGKGWGRVSTFPSSLRSCLCCRRPTECCVAGATPECALRVYLTSQTDEAENLTVPKVFSVRFLQGFVDVDQEN